ncbi:LysR family transcriptional regulator [Chelativorans sp. AA-79]|uniref:LysR family transcriptional regulator n=1 Tax=Chelativorans sp. AA-79 TaxID=3028735 RepID=UPI0023F6509A|nr:LysR family transcriptional regulator [Chelativorans sp. AA-79]WEX08013.1 LysR family transcriptional regulator [Chelativorans sp. AA-79]
MDIRDLEIFLAVAESGSITRAAEMLGCSQPHVTRTIQHLEVELGLALLERVGRRVVLSDEGLAFEGEARRMVQAFVGLADRVRDAAAGSGRVLRIAAIPAICSTLLPLALARLAIETLPEIHLVQVPANGVAKQVRDGMAEIGLSSLPLDTPGLKLVKHYTAPAAAVLHQDDPLAGQTQVKLDDFAGRRQVTMLDPMRFQRQVGLAFAARGVTGAGYVRTNAASNAIQVVRSMKAIALLDPISAWTVDNSDLAVKPVDREVPYHWGVVADPQRPLHPLVEELLDHLEAIARERIPAFVSFDPDDDSADAGPPPARQED